MYVMFICSGADSRYEIETGIYYEGKDRPLTLEIIPYQLIIDSLDAIKIAYKNGGNQFINEYRIFPPGDSFVILEQDNMSLGTGPLIWRVVFSASQKTLHVSIDPYSGEVIKIYKSGEPDPIYQK